ncbi:DUF4279 domain-containing protein [Lentzea sp. BCCO 10_0798]|uniref:DUF4279 domain-containing protein n=1 Tax=Lentzea kristufekii TaxID=3095430 RepID=A0ABU4U3R7_9PSEU|nr:DUF4279 domain-containing protein [Lentzea sp. BCCO 10_0798]MDX8055218.1 DUF4279 domain-containing protein [Lentzea sp. BCCO 10_0798]
MTGQQQHEYKASLRVFSESLALPDLVAALGEPTRSYDIGDLVSPRRPDGPRRTSAYWSLGSQAQRTDPLDQHIAELVTFVDAHRREIDALRDKAQIDAFCGVFTGDDTQGGFTLTSGLMRRLGELNLDVGFDLY